MREDKIIDPVGAKREPRLWIKRLVIYDSYPEVELRSIRFTPGLNIVAGAHNSGKSTLYRFIRYLLGDSVYADRERTANIKAKLENGGLFGEVSINGSAWMVWRPFLPKVNWVDSASAVSLLEPGQTLPPNHDGFADYLQALENLANEFSTHPNFSGADPYLWQDLLELYTRDEASYGDSIFSWTKRTGASKCRLPSSNKECWPFLLKLVGVNTTERDTFSARIAQLEANKAEAELRDKENERELQKLHDRAEFLRAEANTVLQNKWRILDENGALLDSRTIARNRIERYRRLEEKIEDKSRKLNQEYGRLEDKIANLVSERHKHSASLALIEDNSRKRERELRKSKEQLELTAQRIRDSKYCEDGQCLVRSCEKAQEAQKRRPDDIIKDSLWLESNEAKDVLKIEELKGKIQDIDSEFPMLQGKMAKLDRSVLKKTRQLRRISKTVSDLSNQLSMLERAWQLEKDADELLKKGNKSESVDHSDLLTNIENEITILKAKYHDAVSAIESGMGDVNKALTQVAQTILGYSAFTRIERRGDSFTLFLTDGTSGDGHTFRGIVSPLMLDWLSLQFGFAGKTPHHGLLIQDSPFAGEMDPSLQQSYIEMLFKESLKYHTDFQQIICTGTTAATSYSEKLEGFLSLTETLENRLLPGVDLKIHGLFEGQKS